jgi:hypothetical protein
MEAMFTLTCRAARLSPAKEKRHDDIRIPPAVNQNDHLAAAAYLMKHPSFELESSIMPEFTIGNYLATRLEQIGIWLWWATLNHSQDLLRIEGVALLPRPSGPGHAASAISWGSTCGRPYSGPAGMATCDSPAP